MAYTSQAIVALRKLAAVSGQTDKPLGPHLLHWPVPFGVLTPKDYKALGEQFPNERPGYQERD